MTLATWLPSPFEINKFVTVIIWSVCCAMIDRRFRKTREILVNATFASKKMALLGRESPLGDFLWVPKTADMGRVSPQRQYLSLQANTVRMVGHGNNTLEQVSVGWNLPFILPSVFLFMRGGGNNLAHELWKTCIFMTWVQVAGFTFPSLVFILCVQQKNGKACDCESHPPRSWILNTP